jgi:hypothetical protein
MRTKIEEDVKYWTAKRNVAWVMEIKQGKTTVAQVFKGTLGYQVSFK